MSDRRSLLPGSVVAGALSALLVSLFSAPAGALTLSADASADLTATAFATNLGNPVDVAELPDGRVVIIEKGGAVKTFTPGMDDPATDNITIFAAGQNEQGLLGVVADPDFANNQYIYFYASVNQDANNRHQVRRYKLGADGKLSDMKPVIDMGLMGPANHNGGGITIYGGNLYVGVGDTGKNNNTPHNHFGSCLNHANGKILRVSLADATLGQPPADNPLTAVDMVTGCDDSSANDDEAFEMRPPEKRIYAWGFRNPFRIWADPTSGKLWVGDVGEGTREEIDVVEKGKHYGYPFEEGTQKYTAQQQMFQPANTCMGMTPASACVPPITDYQTKPAGSNGGAVMGGRILDGCGWPDAWKSRYIYGDHEQGKVWYLDINATRDGLKDGATRKDFATTNGVTAMRMGTDNALYIVERGAGTVTRIVAKAAPEATPGSCLTTNPTPGGGQGEGGQGGAGGSSPGTAGSSSGGASTGGSSNGTAGSSSTDAGAPSTTGGSGGSSDSGGSATAGAGDKPTTDDGGCGCRVASGSGSAALGLGALGAALGLVLGRRRVRRG